MTDRLSWYRNLDTREVRVNDARIVYRRVGQGPPLVFVHGWPLHGATWRAIVHELQHDYTCYVPDLPGAGDSPMLEGEPELFGVGGDIVRRFAEEVVSGPYGLVGFDSGAAMARLAAARHGDRVAAIVMGNTELPGHAPGMVRVLQAISRLPGSAAVFGALMKSRAYRRSSLGFGGCFVDLDLLDGEFHEAFVEPMILNPVPALRALAHADITGIGARMSVAHAAISAPIQCVWGARDPFFPVKRLPDLVAELREAPEPVIVDEARLLVHEEAPEVFVRACRDTFARGFRAAESAAA